jgi:hypothetical protein
MPQTPRPCFHCGCPNLIFLHDVRVPFGTATSILGMTATKKSVGDYLSLTLAVCSMCGFTQTFLMNKEELARKVPGAQMATVAMR